MIHDKIIRVVPAGEGSPNRNSPNRKNHAIMANSITFFIPNLFKKNGMVRMNSVSDICEIERMIVEYFTTNESLYSGTDSKPLRNESPYIFVNWSAAPSIIENKKNSAIL